MFVCSFTLAQTPNPVPFIGKPLVPAAVPPGGPSFTLTVNGAGFVSGSVVNWNGSALATTYISSVQLKASVLASDIQTAGTATVTVVNAPPGGGTSNVAFLPVAVSRPSVGLIRSDLSLSAGLQSISAITADFNRDGKLDLAVANDDKPGTVAIFLGNGDGTFQASAAFATGNEPYWLASCDFNGDGKPDLVVANFSDSTVSILLGNGDGTFQSHVDYATGVYPNGVMCGDFNGDGKVDVVTSNYYGTFGPPYDTSISILLGNGDGTLQPHVDYLDLETNPFALNIGDFNGDGKLDVAMATDIGASNGIAIYLGNGDGTFQAPVGYATAGGSISVEVADFNGDGKQDLAVGTSAGFSVLLGNGDGTFPTHTDYLTTVRVFGLVAGDFNSDGKLDLVLTNLDTQQVLVMLGNGDGTFQNPIEFSTLTSPYSLALGDFNQDGFLDLAVGYEAGGSTSVMLASDVTLSAASLSFPSQTIHTTSTGQTVTLANTGSSPLIIDTVKATGNFNQTNTCGNIVEVGANCTITVTFTPTKQGVQTGTLMITDNGSPSTLTVSLRGTGTVMSWSPASLSFPKEKVGVTSPPLKVTFTNTGSSIVSFLGLSITGTDRKDFTQTHNCGFKIQAGQSCTVKVTFTPGAKGTRTASLDFYDNGGGSPQVIQLTGTGI